MSKRSVIGILSMLVIGLVVAACDLPESVESPGKDALSVEEPAAEGKESIVEEIEELPTIAEIAANNKDFSTLVTAFEAAGLVEMLVGEGDFTVFAPTNAAFEKAFLALNTSAEALFADTETLTTILTYHIIAGRLMAEDVLAEEELTTVEGSGAAITPEMSNGSIENAQITSTNIEASNGVIHVIDSVILPASLLESLAADEVEELPRSPQ